MNKPIVLLELTGPGQYFSFDEAFALVSDLENEMPSRNQYCLPELVKHLKGESLSSMQETLKGALEIGRAARVQQFNINGYRTRSKKPGAHGLFRPTRPAPHVHA